MAYGDKAVFYDVKKDEARMKEMLEYSGGKRRVPVIVEKGEAQVGFKGS